jgi:predicted XRE-type DNA-binding protein
MLRMDIQYIISAIMQSGLTQTQIAAALRMGQSTVSDMYTGKSGNKRPSERTVTALRKLARKRGVPIVRLDIINKESQ